MNNKIRSTIFENSMIDYGDKIVVAISGGADSVALLCVLNELKYEFGITLSACHVNHGIRGDEAKRDEDFVKNLCGDLLIPLKIFNVDVPSYSLEKGISTELAARELRYDSFNQFNDAKIATAHTSSDNLETVLFAMMRGSGIKGIAGIPPVRDNIIRPLIDISRLEVEEYLSSISQEFIVDSSNLSDDYTRNAVRHNVIPNLLELFPTGETTVRRMGKILRQEDGYLSNSAKEILEDLRKENSYSKEKFLALPIALQHRAIGEFLINFDVEVSYSRISNCLGAINKTKDKIALAANKYLICTNDSFFIETIEHEESMPTFIGININKTDITDDKLMLFDNKISIRKERLSKLRWNSHKNNTTLLFDYDKMSNTITFRTRQEGDRFRLHGRNVSKSLKKWYNEWKIPIYLRNSLIIIENSGKIIGVQGYGVSDDAFVDNTTKDVIIIETL